MILRWNGNLKVSVWDIMRIQNRLKPFDFFLKIWQSFTCWMFSRPYFKIFDTIIKFITVNVMNMFTSQKRSIDRTSHNKSMLKNSWRSAILLFHTGCKNLILFGQTRDYQRIISSLCNRFLVFFFVTFVSIWRWIDVSSIAFSTKSVKWLSASYLFLYAQSKNVSRVFAFSASDFKCNVSFYNFIIIPVYFTIVKKLDKIRLYWRDIRFSAHRKNPFYFYSQSGLYPIIADWGRIKN